MSLQEYSYSNKYIDEGEEYVRSVVLVPFRKLNPPLFKSIPRVFFLQNVNRMYMMDSVTSSNWNCILWTAITIFDYQYGFMMPYNFLFLVYLICN